MSSSKRLGDKDTFPSFTAQLLKEQISCVTKSFHCMKQSPTARVSKTRLSKSPFNVQGAIIHLCFQYLYS